MADPKRRSCEKCKSSYPAPCEQTMAIRKTGKCIACLCGEGQSVLDENKEYLYFVDEQEIEFSKKGE